jgi:3-oxoacyl-[acyl-carrier protein] reductase
MVGKVAIVTGAGRGLGLAYAKALSEGSARLIIVEIDEAAGAAAAKAIQADGGEAHFVPTYTSSEPSTQAWPKQQWRHTDGSIS